MGTGLEAPGKGGIPSAPAHLRTCRVAGGGDALGFGVMGDAKKLGVLAAHGRKSKWPGLAVGVARTSVFTRTGLFGTMFAAAC